MSESTIDLSYLNLVNLNRYRVQYMKSLTLRVGLIYSPASKFTMCNVKWFFTFFRVVVQEEISGR